MEDGILELDDRDSFTLDTEPVPAAEGRGEMRDHFPRKTRHSLVIPSVVFRRFRSP